MCERRARDVVRSWGLRGAGKAVRVWAWGSLICISRALSAKLLYSMVTGLGFCGEERKDLTFRSCRGGVGRGSRVGGRDWAGWSGKKPELIGFDVALER